MQIEINEQTLLEGYNSLMRSYEKQPQKNTYGAIWLIVGDLRKYGNQVPMPTATH